MSPTGAADPNASGELYYATTQRLATAWADQWVFGGDGDGTLFYPGMTARIGGTTPIPLESLRMKMIRNGATRHPLGVNDVQVAHEQTP